MDDHEETFAFVLMPFDKVFDDIYQSGIKETARTLGIRAERVDEQIYREGILERIYQQIDIADIIIADMSGKNLNVFYEVGYAHAKDKLCLLITNTADDIPFDLKHQRHIVYSSLTDLKEKLAENLAWARDQIEAVVPNGDQTQMSLGSNKEEIAQSRMLNVLGKASKWIPVERLSYRAAITPNEAADILRKLPEIVFDKGKDGRLIAKLQSAVNKISDADDAGSRLSTIVPIASNLFSQIKEDLKNDKTGLIMELVVLGSPGMVFNSSKPRFVYYESEHPNLQLIIDRLEDMGFVVNATSGKTPIYRMTPHFMAAMRASTWESGDEK